MLRAVGRSVFAIHSEPCRDRLLSDGAASISEIDSTTGAALRVLPTDYPYYTIIEGIATNTNGSQLYVDFIGGSGIDGPGDDGGIMSFSTSTDQEIAFVPLNPHGAFVLNSAGTTIYASTLSGGEPNLVNKVSVVDTQSNAVWMSSLRPARLGSSRWPYLPTGTHFTL